MRLQQVWIRYGTRSPWVVREATLAIDPGEIVVVLGRNGAGKSTLLGAAAGVLPVSRGAVHDRPRVVGLVPERFPAAQPFTARAYLVMMARLRGLTRPGAVQAVESWAQRQINAGLGAQDIVLITVWAIAWASIVLFGYFPLRRTRP